MLSEKIKEHMLKYIPVKGAYRRTKATISRVKESNCLYTHTQKEKARQVEPDILIHAHAGCVSFGLEASTVPALQSA